MSDIGFTCDVCGRTVQGTTYVNGMKFCAKCYQETFGGSKDWQLLDKDKTIEELEHQLAEKDKEIERLKSCVLSKEQVEEIAKQEIKTLTKTIYETCCHQVCQKIKEKLCQIEDTLINLGNGKEDALNYFVKILDQIEKGESK